MQKKNPKIHFYTLHAGEHPGDFYTNVTGLVTCKVCLRLLKGAAEQPLALDGASALSAEQDTHSESVPAGEANTQPRK